MQNLTKIYSYLGFAVKSKQVIFGYDNIEKSRKRLFLILISPTISKKSLDAVIKVANKKNISYIVLEKNLEDLLKRKNCKVLGITNESLSNAIVTNSKL